MSSQIETYVLPLSILLTIGVFVLIGIREFWKEVTTTEQKEKETDN